VCRSGDTVSLLDPIGLTSQRKLTLMPATSPVLIFFLAMKVFVNFMGWMRSGMPGTTCSGRGQGLFMRSMTLSGGNS